MVPKSIRVSFLFPPKNSGWTKQFLGPPPPPSPALYTVHAWAPQKASVVHSSCGVASVWSAHLQPPPGIDTADIAKYSQPTVALRWFLHLLWTLQMCDVTVWPGAWAGWAGRIWSQDLDTRPETIIMANVGHMQRGEEWWIPLFIANDVDIYLDLSRYLQTDQYRIVGGRGGCGVSRVVDCVRGISKNWIILLTSINLSSANSQ